MTRRRCIVLQVKNEKSKLLLIINFFSFFTAVGHILVATVLLKNGANVNAKDSDGYTPLSVAKKKGHARMVELLKANGAKP